MLILTRVKPCSNDVALLSLIVTVQQNISFYLLGCVLFYLLFLFLGQPLPTATSTDPNPGDGFIVVIKKSL